MGILVLSAHYSTDHLRSVYIAGRVLKKLLATFSDNVDGQEAEAGKKAEMIYKALDAYPSVYKVVPEKSVRSRMNACFRVTKVSVRCCHLRMIAVANIHRVVTLTTPRRLSLRAPRSVD